MFIYTYISSNNEENSQLSQNMQNFCVAAGSSTKVKKPFKKVLPLFSTHLYYFTIFQNFPLVYQFVFLKRGFGEVLQCILMSIMTRMFYWLYFLLVQLLELNHKLQWSFSVSDDHTWL